jgi:hypothetical protein
MAGANLTIVPNKYLISKLLVGKQLESTQFSLTRRKDISQQVAIQ